jgi:hypothetical protein
LLRLVYEWSFYFEVFIHSVSACFDLDEAGHSCTHKTGIADLGELWLETGTADKEAVNVGLAGQFLAILGSNTSSVDDA